MALLKRNTAAALDRAKADLLLAGDKIADLARQREAALSADDTTDQVLAIDRQANEEQRRLGLLQDKIAVLQDRLTSEQAEQREKDYRASVDKIERAIFGLAGVAEEAAAAIRAVPVALERFRSAQQAVLRTWPDNVELPFRFELGLDRIERVLAECFAPFSPGWSQEAREHWGIERKLENIGDVISDFAQAESDGYRAMIDRLRSQSAPKPDEPEAEIAA